MKYTRTTTVIAAAAVIGLVGAGGAVAADLVDSADIRNQSIESSDIGANEVGASELRGDGVRTEHIERGAVRQGDVAKGAVGWGELTPWVQDKVTAAGPAGEPGVSGYEAIGRGTDAKTVESGARSTIETLCASTDSSPEQQDEMALSGGAKSTGDVTVLESYPSSIKQFKAPGEADPAGRWGAAGWTVKVVNNGATAASVQPYVVCATVS